MSQMRDMDTQFIGSTWERLAEQGWLVGWGGGVGVFHEEHVGGLGAERDGVALEGFEDSAAEFAQDGVFLADANAEADGVDDLAAFDVSEAGDVGIGEGDLLEGGIVADLEGDLAEDGEDAVGIGAGVDAEVEGGDGEVTGEVGDGGDLAVGDDVESAVAVAQGGAAEAHVLDGAAETGELDGLADVVLVFDEDEDAVEHVFEDALGTEADADAEDAGGGEQRGEVDLEDGEDVQQNDEADDAVGGSPNDGGHGAQLRGALRVADLFIGQREHAVDEEQDHALEHKGNDENDQDAREVELDEVDDVVMPAASERPQGALLV